jgi:hypothetical protein
MNITDYYLNNFRDDLLKFMPSSRAPYFGHTWYNDCANLEEIGQNSRAQFLICLYFTVLVDQAMHSHYHQDYHRFEELTRYPKFCHGLGQFHKNPRDILSVPVENGLVSVKGLESLLKDGMKLFVDEVTDFFQRYMPHIKTEAFFKKLISDPDVKIPLIFVLADESLKEDIVFKTYEELRKAVNKRFSSII